MSNGSLRRWVGWSDRMTPRELYHELRSARMRGDGTVREVDKPSPGKPFWVVEYRGARYEYSPIAQEARELA